GHALPAVLHRRVRQRRRLRRGGGHAVPRRLEPALRRPRQRLDERGRPARAAGQDHGRQLPGVLGAVHLPPLPGGPAPAARVEGPHPPVAGQHPGDHGAQGGLLMAKLSAPKTPGLVKGLGVTLKATGPTLSPSRGAKPLIPAPSKGAATVQYPHEKETPAARARGVIALKEENCTVCMLCDRTCPDWVIY